MCLTKTAGRSPISRRPSRREVTTRKFFLQELHPHTLCAVLALVSGGQERGNNH